MMPHWWPFQLPPQITCWLRGHQPLLERGASAVQWVCARCRRVLGETVLVIRR